MFEVRRYVTANGRDVFAEWLDTLRDAKAKAAILRRINRVGLGNVGDCKPLRDGVWELRVDVGPGYRVYYAREGKTFILLLCGGDKRRQDADIQKACEYWHEWQERKP